MKTSPIKKTIPRSRTSTLQRLALIAAALTLNFGSESASARPLGVDVSSYQGGGINWGSVKGSGITFAWAKATEGNYLIDADFTGNENNGKGAGVVMGAYHFARPDLNSPGTEANYFWNEAGSHINADGKTLMPMLDFETFNGAVGASSYSDWANQWNDSIVTKASGAGVKIRPFIYTSACSACNFNTSVSQWLSDIADYNGENSQSGTPWSTCGSCDVWGSGSWDAWQYSDSGSVPGISGGTDVDVLNGNLSAMIATSTTTATYSAFIGPIAQNSDGRMQLFGTLANGEVTTDCQTAPSSGWGGWANLNTVSGANPEVVVARNKSGTLEAFCNISNTVWHAWQTAPSSGWTSGWGSLGGTGITNLQASANSDGRLQIFGIGTNGHIWTSWQNSPGGTWTGWTDLGAGSSGVKPGFVVGHNASGTMELFAVNHDNNVWHIWQTSPSSGWGTWQNLTGTNSNPRLAVALNFDGRLQVFAVGENTDIWSTWQNTPGGSWSLWTDMGGGGVKPGFVVGINSDGRLEMFGVGNDTAIWHSWQNSPGSSWTGWASLGGVNSDPQLLVGNNSDGRMQIFFIGSNDDVWTTWQNSPGGSWSTWSDMGGNGTQFYLGQP